MMHRLLSRSGGDDISQNRIEHLQQQNTLNQSSRPRNFSLGYPGKNLTKKHFSKKKKKI
jgi:hypothetical protein